MQDPPDLDADDDSFDLVADLEGYSGVGVGVDLSCTGWGGGVRGVSRTGEFFFP